MEVVTYHDSCHLGRCCSIYDEPRKILELIGYNVKELHNSRVNSICCGSCGGLARTNPGLANQVFPPMKGLETCSIRLKA